MTTYTLRDQNGTGDRTYRTSDPVEAEHLGRTQGYKLVTTTEDTAPTKRRTTAPTKRRTASANKARTAPTDKATTPDSAAPGGPGVTDA